MNDFPENLKIFIAESNWVFAKTYAKTWPHEYIVREKVDENLFLELVKHIRLHGYVGKFYNQEYIYFDDQKKVYWTMGAPVEETIIINRCSKEQTYDYRLAHNDLPN